jgi:hypothetical protein
MCLSLHRKQRQNRHKTKEIRGNISHLLLFFSNRLKDLPVLADDYSRSPPPPFFYPAVSMSQISSAERYI